MAHEKVAQWQGQQQQLDHPSTFNPQPYTPQGQINYQPTMHAPMNASAPPLKEHLQQPAPQASATSADVLNMSNKPKDHNGERDWSHGLCGCFDDCSTCCVACWCPCVTYADTRERLKALRNGQAKPEGGTLFPLPRGAPLSLSREPQTDPTDLGTHRQLLLGSVLGLLLPQLSHWLRLAPDHVPAHRRPRCELPHPHSASASAETCVDLITALPHQRRRLVRLALVCQVNLTRVRADRSSRYSADCCTSFWCHPCAQVQHSREMELEEVALLSSSSKVRAFPPMCRFRDASLQKQAS